MVIENIENVGLILFHDEQPEPAGRPAGYGDAEMDVVRVSPQEALEPAIDTMSIYFAECGQTRLLKAEE